MRPIDSGRLRNQVTFLVPQLGQDATGGALPLIDGDTTWASIDFVAGKSQYGGSTFVAEASHKITMRYRAGVLPQWQVRHDATIFKILYVDNVEQRNVQLDIFCVVLNGTS